MTPAAEKRAEKTRRTRERLRDARHHVLGPIAPAPEPGTVFDPLPMFLDPGWMEALRTLATARMRKCGVGSSGDIPAGYTRRQIRAGAESAAFQAFLDRFLTRDYARAGITASETARAVLSTLRICERSGWNAPGDRRERGGNMFPLLNRAQDSRTPDPRRVVHAARGSAEDTAALLGTEDDRPSGETVPVYGGRYRPWNSGRMVAVDREVGSFTAPVILDGDIVVAVDRAEEYAITATRWKMERRRGAIQEYPAGAVDPGRPAPRMRYTRTRPIAAPGWIDRTTARRLQPLPPVDRETAIANLRRRGRAFPRGSEERAAIATTLRRWR